MNPAKDAILSFDTFYTITSALESFLISGRGEMEDLKKIGMFLAHWIATIVGCFLTLFVVRFLVHQFSIAAVIGGAIEKLAEASIIFIIIRPFA